MVKMTKPATKLPITRVKITSGVRLVEQFLMAMAFYMCISSICNEIFKEKSIIMDYDTYGNLIKLLKIMLDSKFVFQACAALKVVIVSGSCFNSVLVYLRWLGLASAVTPGSFPWRSLFTSGFSSMLSIHRLQSSVS